jgi:DNA-binding protein H-NS
MSEMMNPGYRELLAQREALEKQIEVLRRLERNDAIEWIFKQMVLFDIKPEDLAPSRGRIGKASGLVAPKYRDPVSGGTWSGRGRAPLWMAGQDRERFVITD